MDPFEKFRQILHTHPAGAPRSETFDEILRLLFTPQEVEAALGMGFAPRSVPRIAETAGLSEDEVRTRCESMADKGLIYARRKNGAMGYALLPTIPGLFEFPFMRGGGTPMHDRLGKLWETYHHEALGDEFAGSETPIARVIAVEETIKPQVEVLPYEQLSTMLDGIESFALAQCACRVSVAACDSPRDVCLIFDMTADFLVERQIARRITRDQADDVLRRAEETALVHTTNNSQDRLTFICNCCPCCCTLLRGLTQLHNPNAFAKSRWHAQVEAGLCAGCGVCEDERCPVGAVKVVGSVARVDAEGCIGCGLCVSSCADQAMSMVLRPQAPTPPATIAEMGIKVAVEKGRLDDFLKLMAR